MTQPQTRRKGEKNMNNPYNSVVIGVDHGYQNIKTAHAIFKSGVTAYAKEPTFTHNMLTYEGRYYIIGDEHKEFALIKMNDQDYYILTLAAIGVELHLRGLTSARVHIAAGLPLTWVSEQKEAFKAYLLQNKEADFTFRGESYHVEFVGADVFPQGFSAVADRLREFKGVNMLCDIGNGTMNIMYINNGRPVVSKCFTEKYGTQQCVLAAREKLMQRFGVTAEEAVIEEVLRYGEADIGGQYLDTIREAAKEYANGIMRRLREHEYNPELMKLYVVGGGGCLIENFTDYDPARVTINTDICATAKGYELLASGKLGQKGCS